MTAEERHSRQRGRAAREASHDSQPPPFTYQNGNDLRVTLIHGSSIVQYLPREHQGEFLRPGGSHTLRRLGFQLVEEVSEMGFGYVNVGLNYDLLTGFSSNNHPGEKEGRLLSIPVVAKKATRSSSASRESTGIPP